MDVRGVKLLDRKMLNVWIERGEEWWRKPSSERKREKISKRSSPTQLGRDRKKRGGRLWESWEGEKS